jgi:hypothetical protein
VGLTSIIQSLPRRLEFLAWGAIFLWVFSVGPSTTRLPFLGRNHLAPSLAHLTTLGGTPLTLDPAQKIFLTFFGVPCYWSETELPYLAELARARPDLQIVAVAYGTGRDVLPEVVRAYAQGHEMPYTIALDPEGLLAYRFGVTATPSSFIINPNHTIRYSRHGGGPNITFYQLNLWADYAEVFTGDR